MDEEDVAQGVTGNGARVEESPAPPEPATDEDPLEEVLHDGRRYRVSRALRADYERAAASLAAERQALERERARARDHGELAALNDQLAALEGQDWERLIAENPGKAQVDWVAYMRARDSRDRLARELRHEHMQRMQEAHAEVARDIKDWSPELARRLTEFGRAMGFSDQELGAITDARQIKVLHAAWREQQRAITERLAAAQKYAPVPALRGPAGRPETPPDTDDFLAFERFAATRQARTS